MARTQKNPRNVITSAVVLNEHSNTLGPTGPSYEQIAQRAYQLWESRGGQGGSPEEDWFQAERELRVGNPRH